MNLPLRVLALLAFVGSAAACGLPADEQVTTYNADDLPPALANTTTTTTTTTTLAPPSTLAPTDDVASTTTTLPPFEPSPVDVFYTLGFSDDLQRITLNLPFSPITLRQLIDVLEEPPSEVASFNLRSSLRDGLIVEIVPERGTANVELSQDVLNTMTNSQERRAIAQIVLTVTSFRLENGNLGQVSFSVDGAPIPVFLPADGGDSEPGEGVAFSDFDVLVTPVTPTTSSTTTTTTTSTTTTTTTTTTVPDPETETTDAP